MKLRDDKSWEQATTSDQFAEMYRKQIQEAPARAEVPAPGQIRQLSEDADEADEGGEHQEEDEELSVPDDGDDPV